MTHHNASCTMTNTQSLALLHHNNVHHQPPQLERQRHAASIQDSPLRTRTMGSERREAGEGPWSALGVTGAPPLAVAASSSASPSPLFKARTWMLALPQDIPRHVKSNVSLYMPQDIPCVVRLCGILCERYGSTATSYYMHMSLGFRV